MRVIVDNGDFRGMLVVEVVGGLSVEEEVVVDKVFDVVVF